MRTPSLHPLPLRTLLGALAAFGLILTQAAPALAARAPLASTEGNAVNTDGGLRPAEWLDAREVAGEMQRRQGALLGCYERELRHAPALAGTVELRFTVGRDGTLQHVRLHRDQLRSKALGRCLVARLDGARFPPPMARPVQFAWPLRFQPRG